jgi:rhodanese-related sulfurtransferase
MLDKLKQLFGLQPKADLAALLKGGAIVLDVRTKGEYADGHVKGSVNIPLDQLPQQLNKIDKNKVVITCCASGMRSAAAKGTLTRAGFKEVHNGGSWSNVQRLTQK